MLAFRPLRVSIDDNLIFLSRENLFIAIRPDELDEIIGKLDAIRAGMI